MQTALPTARERTLVPNPGSVLPGRHTGRQAGPRTTPTPSQTAGSASQPLHPPLPAAAHLQARSSRQPGSPARPGVRQETVREGGCWWSPVRTSTFDAPPHFGPNRNAPSFHPTGFPRYPAQKTKIDCPIISHKHRETAAQMRVLCRLCRRGCGARVAPSPRRGKKGG